MSPLPSSGCSRASAQTRNTSLPRTAICTSTESPGASVMRRSATILFSAAVELGHVDLGVPVARVDPGHDPPVAAGSLAARVGDGDVGRLAGHGALLLAGDRGHGLLRELLAVGAELGHHHLRLAPLGRDPRERRLRLLPVARGRGRERDAADRERVRRDRDGLARRAARADGAHGERRRGPWLLVSCAPLPFFAPGVPVTWRKYVTHAASAPPPGRSVAATFDR